MPTWRAATSCSTSTPIARPTGSSCSGTTRAARCSERVEIHPATLTADGGAATIRSRIVTGEREHTLWFELDERYAKYLVTDRLDGFRVAALLRAMRDGEDVVVHGPVSETLLYNLRRHFMPIMALLRPRLRVVRIHAEAVPASRSHAARG